MTTLTEFLLARIAEDEEVARLSTPDPWGRAIVDGQGFAVHRGEHETVALYCDRDNAAHIARHDPARVLAECEAKRRIVEAALDFIPTDGSMGDVALRALAAIWQDHPDYREEWRP